MTRTRSPFFFGVLMAAAVALPQGIEAQTGSQQPEWRKVDALTPGRAVIVTLTSGETRKARFVSADREHLLLRSAAGPAETVAKSSIAAVVAGREARRAAGLGALVGAGAFGAWLGRASSLCGRGCDNDMPPAAALMAAAFGAGVGSLIGYAAARTSGPPEVLFPLSAPSAGATGGRYPRLRVGAGISDGTFRTFAVTEHTLMSSVTAAVLLSPRLSVQIEWTRLATSTFYAANAPLHDQIISGAVPPDAIRRQEQHSARVPYHLAGLVGVHPTPWGRLQPGLFGGLSVQPEETTEFDPFTGPQRTLGQPVLRRSRGPSAGLVLGLDVQIVVTPRFAVVPMVRYDMDFGRRAGVAGSWRFGR
jgi:hypothetical protein